MNFCVSLPEMKHTVVQTRPFEGREEHDKTVGSREGMSAAKRQTARTALDDDFHSSASTQDQEAVPSGDDDSAQERAQSALLELRVAAPRLSSTSSSSAPPARGAPLLDETEEEEEEEAGEVSPDSEAAGKRRGRRRKRKQAKALTNDVVLCLLTAFNEPRSSLFDKAKNRVLWAKITDSMIKHPNLRGHLEWLLTTANFQVTVRNKTKALEKALACKSEDDFLREYADAKNRNFVRDLIPRAADFLRYISTYRNIYPPNTRHNERGYRSDDDEDDNDSEEERKARQYAFHQQKGSEKEATTPSKRQERELRNEEHEPNRLTQKRRRVEPSSEPTGGPLAATTATAAASTVAETSKATSSSSSNNDQVAQLVQLVTRQHHEVQSALSNITALIHQILSVL